METWFFSDGSRLPPCGGLAEQSFEKRRWCCLQLRLACHLVLLLSSVALRGGVKSTRVIFIPGLSLIVWIPRSINSLKVVNMENAT